MNAVKSRGGGGNLRSEGTPAAVFVATVGVGEWNLEFGMGLKTFYGDDGASTAQHIIQFGRYFGNYF